jgi:hypothetical protein
MNAGLAAPPSQGLYLNHVNFNATQKLPKNNYIQLESYNGSSTP